MTTMGSPKCYECIHFREVPRFTCKAFPRRIPREIKFEGFDHTKPFKGDNGIRFEPKKQ